MKQSTSGALDCHTLPLHGEDALGQKHDVSTRRRRQKGLLAFLAHAADTRVFCAAHGPLRQAEQNDALLQGMAYGPQRTGQVPQARLFDSQLTTSLPLHPLNSSGMACSTIRRRSHKRRTAITHRPASAWRRVALHHVSRAYRRPRGLDETIHRKDSAGPMRQLTVADRGHEEPPLLLTKQRHRAPATRIERSAQRMVIANSSADGIDFFPMEALSSAVARKITCAVQLTLLASRLYRLLGPQVGRGYAAAKGRHIFRACIDAVGLIPLTDDAVIIRYQKRAHNPLLLAAGCANTTVPVPWLGGKRLQRVFG